jgi:TolB-like protein
MRKYLGVAVSTILSLSLSLSLLSGCEGTLPMPKPEPVKADIMGSSHGAADALINAAADRLDLEKPVIAASFVNIDDLDKSSSFGRIISRQVGSRFTARGIKVIEMLLRHNVYIRQRGGEFLLSRELRNISSEHDAQAVIVGTYAVGRHKVLITARLIRSSDSVILASHDYTLPLDPDVAYLLRGK